MASNGNSVEESSHYLQSPRVLWGGSALTIAAAVVAVLAVRELAVRVLHPDPAFTPLSLGSSVVGTIGCTMMAIYVFVGMMSYTNPVRTWRRVSAVVLILSFLPLRIIGDFTHYGWRLARGFRSDDDARGRVGDLRNALTLPRDHEEPSQSPGP